jgi:hypothetical protein
MVVVNFKADCFTLRDPITASYIGTDLTMSNSRAFCETMYQATANQAPFSDATAAAKFFEMGADNEKLADADSDLTKPYEQSDKADFKPKAGSALLKGAKIPDDKFFDKVEFIGALGTDDSWLEGEWIKITPFDQ